MKHPLVMLFVLLSFGCGSRATAPSAQTNETADRSDESWFCQVGATDDDWDCVQSEALAATHTPQRLPAARTQTPAVIQVPEPINRSLGKPASTTTPGVLSNTAAVTSEPVATPAPKAKASTENVPKHIALSYRPDKPIAILDLPADFWAVQLVALSSKEALEKWAKENKVSGMSAARIWNGQQMFYILLLGIYETRANAEEAIASLLTPFVDQVPWVRSVGSLQAAMLEADRESGTSEI
jgi:septal ring-binding cell division protein DamX